MIRKLIEQKNWDLLVQQLSWMRGTDLVPQHALRHVEGGVTVHTRMVLEVLQQQPSYLGLAEQDREILWAAALLYDVEKRSTSVDEGDGQIAFKDYAKRGEVTVRTLLYRDISTPFGIRRHIVSLVCRHGLPI